MTSTVGRISLARLITSMPSGSGSIRSVRSKSAPSLASFARAWWEVANVETRWPSLARIFTAAVRKFSSSSRIRMSAFMSRGSCCAQWKREGEACALASNARAFDAPAVLGNDLLCQSQTQSRSDRFGGEKRSENLHPLLIAHAFAGVGQLQHHLVNRARGAQREIAAVGHRFQGVADQIENRLPELIRVRLNRRQ